MIMTKPHKNGNSANVVVSPVNFAFLPNEADCVVILLQMGTRLHKSTVPTS